MLDADEPFERMPSPNTKLTSHHHHLQQLQHKRAKGSPARARTYLHTSLHMAWKTARKELVESQAIALLLSLSVPSPS